MSQKNEVPCPVCGSTKYSVRIEPKVNETDPAKLYGAASGVRDTQRIVECAHCEMIYETPRLPESEILRGYAGSQESGHDSQYPMRVESFYRALKRLKKFLPPPDSKVLDIGTAGGAFLDAAKKYGYVASGLEPSEYLTERAVERGLQVQCGTIEKNQFPKDSFDMITMWDVIEHVVEPKQSLELIKPLLKKNGVLLINYPDIGTWQAKLAREKFWWLLSSHLHYFTPKTIRILLERTGYEVLGFKPYWQTLQFGYLEDVAVHLKVPLTKPVRDFTPQFVRDIPLSYYASQTTVIARPK